MKRVQYLRYGGPEVWRLDDVEIPQPGRGQIRVRVKAAGANPMDWKIRKGFNPILTGYRFPRGVGHDFAGVVEAVGSGVTRFKPGDEVFGATGLKEAGTFSEALVTDEKNAIPKPPSVPFEQAGSLAIVGATAWNALFGKGKLKAGQSIFVTGCLGGVGRAAVQLAVMHGAKAYGSCGATAIDEAKALGVIDPVDYRIFKSGDYPRRFDVVFDTVGVLSMAQTEAMLKPGGVGLHIVPTLAKMITAAFSSSQHVVFGVASPECIAGITQAATQGRLVQTIGRTVSLAEAIPALIALEKTGLPKGKLVVDPAL